MKKIIITSFLLFSMNAFANLNEIFGNASVGDSCTSDYQCDTLCCNRAQGTCAPHNPSGSPATFCSKEAGQQCISSEFCKAYYVPVCKIVKNGTNADGSVACVMRCPSTLINGTCKNSYCVPPLTPPVPSFDPSDCSSAVDP